MKQIILVFFTLFGLSFISLAQDAPIETVYLKNGNILKGYVFEQIPNKSIKIQTTDGNIFLYKINDVEKITTESTLPDTGNQTIFQQPKYDIIGGRGFIDVGYTLGTGDYALDRIEVSCGYGMQFNPHFFIGGGIGFHYYFIDEADQIAIPLLLDMKANFTEGKIIPFAELRLGYPLLGFYDLGIYLAPSLGVKAMTSEENTINLSLGYTFQFAETRGSYYGHTTRSTESLSGFSLKLGFEF